MTSAVWLNIPLAVLVILAIVGIPLWMTFKRPQTVPDHRNLVGEPGVAAMSIA